MIEKITIRARFSVQSGRHEKLVYLVEKDAPVSRVALREQLRTGNTEAFRFMVEATVVELLRHLEDRTAFDTPLAQELVNGGLDVLQRHLVEEGKPL